MSNQISHPQKTGKIIVLNIIIFLFLNSKLEDKIFFSARQQAFPEFNLLWISDWTEFWSVSVLSKYLNSIICKTLYQPKHK
jgi:hypothetical protein